MCVRCNMCFSYIQLHAVLMQLFESMKNHSAEGLFFILQELLVHLASLLFSFVSHLD